MSDIVLTYNEKDLFAYLQKTRLETAKRLNDLNIEKSKSIKEENVSFKGTMTNIGHFFKRSVGNYGKKDDTIVAELNKFNNNNKTVIDESVARGLAFSLFQNDKYGLAKLIFAVTVIVDDDYQYKYTDEGLAEASSVLFGNREELAMIKTQLEANYNAIFPHSLSSVQKGLLLGAAIMALAGVVTMPVLLGAGVGASGPATTAALAAHGFGDMQIGLIAFTAESLAVGAVITGAVYGGMKLYNDAKVKKEFLSLTPENNALCLAIQCTYIERAKKTLSNAEFKDQLDSILRNLGILKSDLDFYLFVENESTKENKKKIKSFHEFDNRLIKVLDL